MTDLYIPRYSPQPIEAYSYRVHGIGIGPGYSQYLRSDAEAWNLAWLSHEYERTQEHIDPLFTRRVLDTVNMARRPGARSTIRLLLRLSPSEFWPVFRPIAENTPLFAAYGSPWVDTVRRRALAPWTPAEHQSGLDITQAAQILSKFTNARV